MTLPVTDPLGNVVVTTYDGVNRKVGTQPPALAVPAEHGFRFHDMEVIAPGWPRAVQPDPEHPIRVGQAGTRVGAKGDLELVAEDEVLKCDVVTSSEGGKKTADDEMP
jgi:hypothetical protein